MPLLISRYCGMCRYLSNSAAQASGESGGTMPIRGGHSVIDRPDMVNRVTPPITTMTKIMPQHANSQIAIGKLSRPGARPRTDCLSVLAALAGVGCTEVALVEVFMPATLTLRDALLAWAAWKSV